MGNYKNVNNRQYTGMANNNNQKNKKSFKRNMIIILVALIVVVAAVVVMFIVNSGGNESYTKKSNKARLTETEISGGNEFYSVGDYHVQHDNNIYVCNKNGISVTDTKTGKTERIFVGEYNESFITNGKKIYFIEDRTKVYEGDLETREKTLLCDLNFDETGVASFLGKAGDYIYFYIYGETYDSIKYYNMQTEEICDFKSDERPRYIHGYNEKIYYSPAETSIMTVSLYEASPDGSDETVIAENISAEGADFRENMVYYIVVNDVEGYNSGIGFDGTIMSYDIEEKTEKVVLNTEISSYSANVAVTDFGYLYTFYNDAAGETEYYMDYNDGDWDSYFGYPRLCEDDFIIVECEMNAGNGVAVEYIVLTEDGASQRTPMHVFVDIAGYGNNKIYYYDFESGNLKTIHVEF